jgi:haloacetate dehalogenase
MCEDYRAGLGPDYRHDEADRHAGRRINFPVRVLWATRDDMADLYGDVLAGWRGWADDLRGGPVESGHHIAEEAPGELVRALLGLWRADRPPGTGHRPPTTSRREPRRGYRPDTGLPGRR